MIKNLHVYKNVRYSFRVHGVRYGMHFDKCFFDYNVYHVLYSVLTLCGILWSSLFFP